MRILNETADQVVTYRAVWYYTESRPLCQKLHPKQMRRTNQVMTTQLPSSDELNTKALTVLRAARNVFLTHGLIPTTDLLPREAGVSKSTVIAHSANKEALFGAVIEAECSALSHTGRGLTFRRWNLRNN